VALTLGILYFFVSPSAETIIYQAFSASAFVTTLVGIRLYRPAPAHHWWLFATASVSGASGTPTSTVTAGS
jgi:hypothetical protein